MREKLTKRNDQTGFTIIEVVLVLAIAGLIFLIVFLALPQLQRSRRDTQRKSDAGRLTSALENYAGNNNGDYPAANTADAAGNFGGDINDSNSFLAVYMSQDNFVDPNGDAYVFTVSQDAAFTSDQNQIDYTLGESCDGTSAARNIAVRVGLEDGEYCQDNL